MPVVLKKAYVTFRNTALEEIKHTCHKGCKEIKVHENISTNYSIFTRKNIQVLTYYWD
jgi:hypothetical protein